MWFYLLILLLVLYLSEMMSLKINEQHGGGSHKVLILLIFMIAGGGIGFFIFNKNAETSHSHSPSHGDSHIPIHSVSHSPSHGVSHGPSLAKCSTMQAELCSPGYVINPRMALNNCRSTTCTSDDTLTCCDRSGDYNGDGVVDMQDLLIIQSKYDELKPNGTDTYGVEDIMFVQSKMGLPQ